MRSQGIYPQNYGDVIQNNVVYNCEAWGISAYHACTNTIISNNLVFGNKAGGILGEAAPQRDGNPNRVVWDNSIVSNNIIINNGGYGISNSSSALVGSHNQYLNNFIYGNASGAFALNGNHTYIQSGNITTNSNPGFVNYQSNGTGDYHLASGSPCIGAGTSQGADPTDHDGVKRPQQRTRGSGYDIGPYEWTAPLTHSRDASQHKVQLVLAAAWEAITRLKSVGCTAGHPPCNNGMMNHGLRSRRNPDVGSLGGCPRILPRNS